MKDDPDLLDRIDELSRSLFEKRPDLIELVEISVPRLENTVNESDLLA